MTRTNPACYRCTSLTPLPAGVTGLCRTCAEEVNAKRILPSSQPFCSCGKALVNDWERVQHQVNNRHNYQAWVATTEEATA